MAFGTIFMPSDEDMGNLVEAIKLLDPEKDGIIVSLKENQLNYQVLKDLNLPNVLLTSWAP